MIEWSDDEEILVAPLSSMKAPPCSACIEDQSRGGEGVLEQQAIVAPMGQAMGVLEQQARGVPEH